MLKLFSTDGFHDKGFLYVNTKPWILLGFRFDFDQIIQIFQNVINFQQP